MSDKFDFEENATQHEQVAPQNSPRKASTQDASRENPPTSLDLESMSDDEENMGVLNYVDVNDFVQLQTCFDSLSKSHDTLNQNVMMLTELITNFIEIHSPQDAAGHAQVSP